MGRFVIVAYAPQPGQEKKLLALAKKHMTVLKEEDLVTDKPSTIMRAANGTILEVFEWRSAEAVQQAHTNPRVQALWEEFDTTCDFVRLAKLDEAQ